ncbi:hypothetical protein [Streptomyces sp. NPDC002346]
MLKALKIRRAAAQLTEAFPEIPAYLARNRARQMIARYPSATTHRVGEYLIHNEHVTRLLTNVPLMTRLLEEMNREINGEETA